MRQDVDIPGALGTSHPEVADHAERVADLARAIATRLRWSKERLDALDLGARLHDVGKLALAPGLLSKTGPLDDAERAAIRVHPIEGMWLISGVPSLAGALPYVLFHHERWDGGGYPTGRAGSEIPIEGRVMATADAFDAMTSDRPYRDALSIDAAVDEVRRCAGSQFDPEIAEVFLEVIADGNIVLASV
jgi:HD-GYP domain-containing protein (c-di-GMP phosphodiesterase class II)